MSPREGPSLPFPAPAQLEALAAAPPHTGRRTQPRHAVGREAPKAVAWGGAELGSPAADVTPREAEKCRCQAGHGGSRLFRVSCLNLPLWMIKLRPKVACELPWVTLGNNDRGLSPQEFLLWASQVPPPRNCPSPSLLTSLWGAEEAWPPLPLPGPPTGLP